MLKINHLFLILAAGLFAASGMISVQAADSLVQTQKQAVDKECLKDHKNTKSIGYKNCVKAKSDATKVKPETNPSTPK